PQCQVKAVLEWMSGRPSETLRKPLRIAVIAACTDLCATSDGIPRRIRPFDSGAVSHLRLQNATDESYTHVEVDGLILAPSPYAGGVDLAGSRLPWPAHAKFPAGGPGHRRSIGSISEA